MKSQDLKPGVTYRGKRGPDRRITGISHGEVTYQRVGDQGYRNCWWATFAEWAKEIVTIEVEDEDEGRA